MKRVAPCILARSGSVGQQQPGQLFLNLGCPFLAGHHGRYVVSSFAPRTIKHRNFASLLVGFRSLQPHHAPAHYHLACLHLEKGDRGAALDEYRVLQDLDEERANRLFKLVYRA